MKKIIIFLLSVTSAVIIFSCSNSVSSQNKPTDLIPEDTMVDMIAEQLIFESTIDFVKQEIEREDTNLFQQVNRMVGNESLPIDSFQMGSMHVLTKLTSTHYNSWLKKKGYSYSQYENSLIYYFNTSESTNEIMQKVKNRISHKYGKVLPPPTPNPAMPN